MELTIKLNFWFDGIDNCTDAEIKDYLLQMLRSGAESTASEVDKISIILEGKHKI